MKKPFTWLLVACLGYFMGGQVLAATSPAPQNVLSAISKNAIEIGLSYRGDQVLFFGVNPVSGSDIVVKLTAEKQEAIKLDVKGRVGPFWMTVKQYEVSGAPFIYKVFATKPLAEIASPETIKDLELGYDAVRHRMKMHLIRGKAAVNDPDIVWQGLLKIKKKAKLYELDTGPQAMQITEDKLFKIQLQFPSACTEGRYQVESYCFLNGQMVGHGKKEIQVRKVGLESWLTHTSRNQSLLYGILAVLVALGVGLLVGMIFKKGGH
jgi:uncharacterized protein (TIGR02186 family)